jgi:hypothetical protein
MNVTSEATAVAMDQQQGNSQAGTQIVAALLAAGLEFAPLVTDSENTFKGYRYASLAALIAATRPALASHGLVLVHRIETDAHGVTSLVTSLFHTSGEHLESVVPLPGWTGPQEFGSLLTYLRRYSDAGLLNIASETDDDGEGAEHGQRKASAATARRGARNDAAIARRDRAPQRAAQRETAPKQVRDDVVKNPDDMAETLADLIDIAGTTAQLDSLVPQLSQLPAQYRPPLRIRFSERRNALAEIERDRAELDALENPEE